MGNGRIMRAAVSRRMCLQGMAGAAAGLVGGTRLMAGGGDDQAKSTPPSPPLARGGEDLAASTPTLAKGGEQITLERSLRLAGAHLLGILNPDENYLPYWQLGVELDYKAGFGFWWPAHNLGRWWDAVLRLEEAIGFEIPKPIEKAMVENTHRFFDNPDHISLGPNRGKEWDLHSLREGMLGLHGLARWRKDGWAAEMGHKMVESLDAKLRDDGRWEVEKFDACQKRGRDVIHNFEACDTHGRMLEALIWFFEVTGDEAAFRLAERIARWHFANTTLPEGTINPAAKADHTHSYLGTLRGLLLWGRLTRQREYIDRVATTYRVTVPRFVHESGFTSHNMVQESFGETTSPGDAAQLALWLFQDGHADFIEDAERLVRARILPSQILSTPPLKPAADDGKDAHRDLEKRIIGGYGGCHGHPHGGKRAVTDVTSADVHTLVDIYQHIVAAPEGRVEVIFHLDGDSPQARVISKREKRATLIVTPKSDAVVAIRVPKWVPRESVQMKVGAEETRPVFAGAFVWTKKVKAGTPVAMQYDLPERQTHEKGLGVESELFWRGDDVVGVRPNMTFYPFYADGPGR